MTYNTGNAVPSTDPRDLDDNAQAFDRFMQSTANSEPDRRGVPRLTWTYVENAATALVSPNVMALAGLAGSADQLPYFTGAGALSLATLTAFARTLLDDASQGAMQATLGLVPTTSTTDSTVGRLLRVADFGIGGTPPTVTDLDTLGGGVTTTFRAVAAATNNPGNGTNDGGSGIYLAYSATNGLMMFQVVGTNRTFTRAYSAGAWGAWSTSQVVTAALTAIAALTPAANTFPYWTSGTAAANAPLTAGMRAGLGLTPAANQIIRWTSATAAVMQTFSTGAQALTALTYAADQIGYTTSASAAAVTPLTSFGRSLIDDADAPTARTTIGVLAQTDKPAWTTFTPVISAVSGAYTTTSSTGKYVVLFGICHFQIKLTFTTKGTGVGPKFTLPATALSDSTFMPLLASEQSINGKTGAAFILTGGTQCQIKGFDNSDIVTGDGAVIYIAGSYPVA